MRAGRGTCIFCFSGIRPENLPATARARRGPEYLCEGVSFSAVPAFPDAHSCCMLEKICDACDVVGRRFPGASRLLPPWRRPATLFLFRHDIPIARGGNSVRLACAWLTYLRAARPGTSFTAAGHFFCLSPARGPAAGRPGSQSRPVSSGVPVTGEHRCRSSPVAGSQRSGRGRPRDRSGDRGREHLDAAS